MAMSNVFISHSSSDKPFVRKLAASLVSDGFPVWLDSWQLELGDSLLDRVYDGIDTSSVLLLVVSEAAVASGWVNRELNAALAKEQQSNRRFVIPIRLDLSAMPLKVADRFYSDFSSSFSEPFVRLTSHLSKAGCRQLQVSPEKELLPISFTNEVHLDVASVSRALRYVHSRQGVVRLSGDQVVINDDPEYIELARRLHARIDGVATDPYFSARLEHALRDTLSAVQTAERQLADGLALMASHDCSGDALYWYSRIVRGRGVYQLWSAQTPDAPDLLQYGRKHAHATLISGQGSAQFFEVAQVSHVDVWRRHDAGTYATAWVDTESLSALFDEQHRYLGPAAFRDVYSGVTADKYLLPQLVLAHLRDGAWMEPCDLDDLVIGVH